MLSNYMNNKGAYMNQKIFIQKHKNETCYNCDKKGHYANKCPDEDNDDEASIRSSLSNRSNNHVEWSS
jgi:hypothetical protein